MHDIGLLYLSVDEYLLLIVSSFDDENCLMVGICMAIYAKIRSNLHAALGEKTGTKIKRIRHRE